jgi:hypothetical protein
MAKLKPWFHVVTPREDLREGKPLDASEFAVHLDHVREGRAPQDYQDPSRFFDRTYLTVNLTDLAAQVIRRLSGIQVETSAVFNMATQFGGGKTHALTALYHLAKGGPAAEKWRGVRTILDRAQVASVPKAQAAVFVGTEFDSVMGRGGVGDEPRRFTPWGEIAWQLAGPQGFATVAEHDRTRIAPAGDAIRAFLPADQPVLILLDELMNYISRNRQSGLSAQLYNFIQNLSEEARAHKNLVLAVSIPASELEMNPEDQRDYESLKKLLDRLGKAVIMAVETETAEIIRRRLFDWTGLPEEAKRTVDAYANWIDEHRQIVGDFDADTARERFEASYPFHPALLSVFERKWQTLPRFQKTRGVLRLLALWVSHAYQSGYKGAHRDPLIGLGTAPIADPMFRAALFEQLGNSDLDAAVTTDIAGRKDAHATRLDREATPAVKQARLHQKVASVILFESNGGQTKAEATVPEIRLGVAEPDLDIANVETALDALTASCYYLNADRNRYRFSQMPGLNKILTDRRATIAAKPAFIEDRVRKEVQTVFGAGPTGIERVYFPKATLSVDNRPVLILVVIPPDQALGDPGTRPWIEDIVRNYGSSSRTFKSALFFAVAEGSSTLQEEAKKLLAYEDIQDDDETVKRLDDSQRRQLRAGVDRAARDIKEAVWHTYHYLLLLGKDNAVKDVNLGMINSSMAPSLVEVILQRLRTDDEIVTGVGPNKLVKYWPPAMQAWSTKAVRDAFFSSPALPRLLDPNSLRRTIVDGVAQGILAYAGKDAKGCFEPLHFEVSLSEADLEFSDEMFLLTADEARRHIEPPKLSRVELKPANTNVKPGDKLSFGVHCFDQHGRDYPCPPVTWSASGGKVDQKGLYVAESTPGYYTVTVNAGNLEARAEIEVASGEITPPPPPPGSGGIRWQGEVPPQKWMNFYTKVLSRFVGAKDLKLEVRFEVPAGDAVTKAKIDEARSALRELGLAEDVEER